MNDEGLCYCGSLDCLGNLRVMLEAQNKKVAGLEAKHEQVMADWAKSDSQKALRVGNLESKLEQAREWLIEQKDEMSGEEFVAVYEDLANILDVNLEEEVTVEVVMTQTLVVKVPLGHELTEQDFWANGRSEIIDCNYTIEREEGDIEIEDIRVNTRY